MTDAIASRPPAEAAAGALLTSRRDHRGIANRRHDVRDATFDEDRSAVRTAAAPRVGAACRNLVTALRRRAGVTTFAGRPLTAIALVATAGFQVLKRP
jgi:hypothetical protein